MSVWFPLAFIMIVLSELCSRREVDREENGNPLKRGISLVSLIAGVVCAIWGLARAIGA